MACSCCVNVCPCSGDICKPQPVPAAIPSTPCIPHCTGLAALPPPLVSVDVSGAAFVLPARNNEQLIPRESLHGRHCSPSSSPRAVLGRTSVFPTLSVFVQSKLGSESSGKYFYNRTKHKPSWCRWRMLAPLPMCAYRAEATMCCVNSV